MAPTPLLILSDAPTANTGLGRICRDLATRINANLPEIFRLATLGYAGPGSRHLGFPQYAIQSNVTENGWYVPELKQVWEDFAGSERGIVLTIWDPSRMRWLAKPELCPHPEIAAWLTAPPFEKWGYFAVDAVGPNGKLTAVLGDTIKAYDRALFYSQWAALIAHKTLGESVPCESLPHGIDTSVFQPRDKARARINFRQIAPGLGLSDSSFLVGIVATNQPRKDFGLGLETCSLLAKDRDLRLWIHTDLVKRYWDLVALVTDFGLLGRVVITTNNFSDEQMSWLYSACDVTLGIGLSEGFGFPLFESMACGVPVVHVNDGGAAEHLPPEMLTEPVAWQYEGQFNCLRPVCRAKDWAKTALTVVGETSLPEHLDWNNLWEKWQKWLLQGQP